MPSFIRNMIFVALLAAGASVNAFAQPSDGPAIWKVEGGRSEMWLFGTFHLLPQGYQWRSESVNDAFRQSRTLVMEAVEPEEEERERILRRHGLNRRNVTLNDWLTEEQAGAVSVALEPLGISMDQVQPFKPWYVAVLIASQTVNRMGFSDAHGADEDLAVEADERGMKKIYFDSAERAVKAISDHPAEVQVDMLMRTISDRKTIADNVNKLLETWVTGDVEAHAHLQSVGLSAIPEIAEATLYERNRRWSKRLIRMLKRRGSSHFVAVGSAHMTGPDGLIALLEARGYRVTRQ